MVNTLYFYYHAINLRKKKDKTNYFLSFFKKNIASPKKNNHFSSIQNYKYREKKLKIDRNSSYKAELPIYMSCF